MDGSPELGQEAGFREILSPVTEHGQLAGQEPSMLRLVSNKGPVFVAVTTENDGDAIPSTRPEEIGERLPRQDDAVADGTRGEIHSGGAGFERREQLRRRQRAHKGGHFLGRHALKHGICRVHIASPARGYPEAGRDLARARSEALERRIVPLRRLNRIEGVNDRRLRDRAMKESRRERTGEQGQNVLSAGGLSEDRHAVRDPRRNERCSRAPSAAPR